MSNSNERVFLFPFLSFLPASPSIISTSSVSTPQHETTTHAYLPTNWSSGMSYGGGGVAKGGHGCRYRMHEIGVCRPRRESVHFTTSLCGAPSRQPLIHSQNRLTGSGLTYSAYAEKCERDIPTAPRPRNRTLSVGAHRHLCSYGHELSDCPMLSATCPSKRFVIFPTAEGQTHSHTNLHGVDSQWIGTPWLRSAVWF